MMYCGVTTDRGRVMDTGAEYGRQGQQVTWTTESLQRDFDVVGFSYGVVVVVRKADHVKGSLEFDRGSDGSRYYHDFIPA
jgi:hypothetical protein